LQIAIHRVEMFGEVIHTDSKVISKTHCILGQF